MNQVIKAPLSAVAGKSRVAIDSTLTTLAQQSERFAPPTAPREWTIAQICQALSRPLPKSLLKTRKQGGANLTYIPWYEANKILDKYAPGWTWEITKMVTTPDRIFVTGRLTIPAAEGNIYREATGTELLKEDKEVWVGEKPNSQRLRDDLGRVVTESKELAYGDPTSNAESMAFRRAAARFGLALYLYDKD